MENIMELSEIINQKVYNLLDSDFVQKCKIDLDQNGVLTLSNFLKANTLKELVVEAEDASSASTTSSFKVLAFKKFDRVKTPFWSKSILHFWTKSLSNKLYTF